MSDMADVLEEHQIGLAWEDGEERGITCICGQDLPTEQERGEIDMTFLAKHQADALSAAGFGPVKDEAHKLKSVRGELKTLGKNLDSWESEGHTTATIRFLRQWIGRATKATL